MKKFIISPPFGNYISHPKCDRIQGSFTLSRRPGLIKNTIKSLRPISGGWVNKIGLRNPGISNLKTWNLNDIYSIVGLEDSDWGNIYTILPKNLKLELNLGCPNVHEYGIDPSTLKKYLESFEFCSLKLSPTNKIFEIADLVVDCGAKILHLSNTIPTDRGGESGRRLKELNLPIIEQIASKYPDVKIIAGGGIYTKADIISYENAGATYFSLSTVWFNPIRALLLLS